MRLLLAFLLLLASCGGASVPRTDTGIATICVWNDTGVPIDVYRVWDESGGLVDQKYGVGVFPNHTFVCSRVDRYARYDVEVISYDSTVYTIFTAIPVYERVRFLVAK